MDSQLVSSTESSQPGSDGKRDVDSHAKQIILSGEDLCPTSSVMLGMSDRQALLVQRCAVGSRMCLPNLETLVELTPCMPVHS